MGLRDVTKHNLLYKGNNFLLIGTIWGFIAAFVCPCPYCVLGTLSFLSAGVVDKLGFGERFKDAIGTIRRESQAHDPDTCEHCVQKHSDT